MHKSWLHVPFAGYWSYANADPVSTVINELSSEHIRAGGQVTVIARSIASGLALPWKIQEVSMPSIPYKSGKTLDAALGFLNLPRLHWRNVYDPASKAVGANFDGTIFIHDMPAVLDQFKSFHKNASVCLYAHRQFASYTPWELRKLVSSSAAVISVSDFLSEQLRGTLGPLASRIHTVLNGVDTQRFTPSARQKESIPVVLFVGRIQRAKGPDLLIRAAQKIVGKNRQFRLRIVGSEWFCATLPLSKYEIELRKLAAPISQTVEFHPFVDRKEIVKEYGKADIFCAPSNWDDPCPLTIPEALACGLPTIASRRGGIPELGKEAILYFSPPDVNQLAELLAHLIDSPESRVELGKRARLRAEELSWQNQYRKLQTILY